MFTFDVETFTAAAKAQMQAALGASWSKVEPIANTFFESKKERLKQLATDFANGELGPDGEQFFKDRVIDEAKIFESEAAALSDIGRSMAETTLNNFAAFFLQTVLNLLVAL